ncbi:MAG: peptidylprolyl isomerase [Thermodesulfobacteriaceae bacterium]|nr:peptidylprolyl isomerase [Thermodesulfobacteriaceae bacterium]
MKNLKLVIILLVMFVFPLKIVAEERNLVAEVGGHKLYKEELNLLVEEEPQLKQILKTKPELKNEIYHSLINRWINLTLLYLQAEKEGVSKDSQIQKKLEELKKMYLAEEYLKRKVEELKIEEEGLKNYYEKNKERYKKAEGVKVRHILIYVPEKADNTTFQKALTKANQIYSKILKGASFEEMAKLYSDDTTSKVKGGDLGIIRKGETIPEFEREIFKLKVGEISKPIRSPYGYHIVKIEKKVPAELLSFDKVKNLVEEDYRKEQEKILMEKLLKELYQTYQPKIYLEATKEVSNGTK